jgi:nucleoside-diphosphate-sugar epimerase
MRIVVIGATGNVGTSVLDALMRDEAVESIVGVARRLPDLTLPKTSWRTADVAVDDLEPILRGADCVIHLAWLIQPGRDLDLLQAVNVEGSARVFQAVAAAGVGSLVYASSVGAYSPAPKDRRVAGASWRLHLQPTEPGWLDMARAVPVMDTARARRELGWEPTRGADEALLELLDGIRDGAEYPTPPLARAALGSQDLEAAEGRADPRVDSDGAEAGVGDDLG